MSFRLLGIWLVFYHNTKPSLVYSNHWNQWRQRSPVLLSPSSVRRLLSAASSLSPSRLSSSRPAASLSPHARKAPTAAALLPGLRLSSAEGLVGQVRTLLEERMRNLYLFVRFSRGLMWRSMHISSPLKMLTRSDNFGSQIVLLCALQNELFIYIFQ